MYKLRKEKTLENETCKACCFEKLCFKKGASKIHELCGIRCKNMLPIVTPVLLEIKKKRF